MGTKEAIKSAACTLFNTQGLSAVTLRDVAQAMNRSYGNITYHFAAKEALVEAIYVDMATALGQVTASFATDQGLLESILEAPRRTFAISLRYLFLYRDYLEIIRSYPNLAEIIRHSNAERKAGLQSILLHLQQAGWLRPELNAADINYLMELSGAMRTFFFLQILPSDLQKPTLESEYVEYVNRLLFPYLSPAGQAVYERSLAH